MFGLYKLPTLPKNNEVAPSGNITQEVPAQAHHVHNMFPVCTARSFSWKCSLSGTNFEGFQDFFFFAFAKICKNLPVPVQQNGVMSMCYSAAENRGLWSLIPSTDIPPGAAPWSNQGRLATTGEKSPFLPPTGSNRATCQCMSGWKRNPSGRWY